MCSNTQPAFQSALLVSECGLSSTPDGLSILIPPPGWAVLLSQKCFCATVQPHASPSPCISLLAAVFFSPRRVGWGWGWTHSTGPLGTGIHCVGLEVMQFCTWKAARQTSFDWSSCVKLALFSCHPLHPRLCPHWLCLDPSPFYWVPRCSVMGAYCSCSS